MSEPSESPATPTAETAKEIGRVQWWIDTIVANAPALRDAGINTIRVGDYAASLLAKPAELPKFDDIQNEELPDGLHPLEDPRSYPGGIVPGFQIEKLPTED